MRCDDEEGAGEGEEGRVRRNSSWPLRMPAARSEQDDGAICTPRQSIDRYSGEVPSEWGLLSADHGCRREAKCSLRTTASPDLATQDALARQAQVMGSGHEGARGLWSSWKLGG